MLKNQNSQNAIAPARRIYSLFKVLAVVALVFALPAIFPFFRAVAASGKFSASLIPLAQMKESLRAVNNLIAGDGTGVVEICKSASGAGLENKVFQFKISGYNGTIQVPVGGCSQPIVVPAGMATIEEMSGGSFINRPGTFTGGFRLLDAAVIQSDPSQPNPIVSKNLSARTVTLNVREGGIQNGTVIQFTNTYAASGFVEICNRSAGETGFVQYAVPGLSQNVVVPRNACSAPIQITIPATFGASGATGTVRINQLSKQGVTLESAATNPFDRFNSATLGLGINIANQECLNVPDPTLVDGCTFNNSGGGYVDVDVVEGGTSQETLVYFDNRVEPARLLKICKVAGAGVAIGTNFTFDFYINNEPEIGAAPVTVPAGDPSTGGNCVFAQGQSAPFFNGIGSFPANSTVTVVERPASGTIVSAIISTTGTISGVNLAQRKAAITIADGINEMTFTNQAAAPPPEGTPTPTPTPTITPTPTPTPTVTPTPTPTTSRLLKICKIAGNGIAVGTLFTFDITINGAPSGFNPAPVTVAAGDSASGGNCFLSEDFVNFGYSADTNVTVTERPTSGVFTSAIEFSGGAVPIVNLAERKATIMLGSGVNVLTFTNAALAPVTVPTASGTDVSVAPTTDLNLTFGNISTAGATTVTVLPAEDVPSIPSGFALSGNSLLYEITTSAAYTGNITVSFDVPNVADAAACSQLRILHYTNGAWDTSGNAEPVYKGETKICTVSQIVTSLSPFAVGIVLDSDNDGVPDITDAFPFDPNESVDTDGDGTGNNADTDDDNDGQSDEAEIACGSNPLDAASKCAPPTNGPPTNINQCKNGGWKLFDTPRRFKNQGDCIQFVNTGK